MNGGAFFTFFPGVLVSELGIYVAIGSSPVEMMSSVQVCICWDSLLIGFDLGPPQQTWPGNYVRFLPGPC